jgi:hypothetical protein
MMLVSKVHGFIVKSDDKYPLFHGIKPWFATEIFALLSAV